MKAFIQHKDKSCNKMVMQALIGFMELKDSVVFTSKTNLNRQNKSERRIAKESLDYYQRRIDTSRIAEIEHFIIESILDERNNIILATLFPSSMIIAITDEENDVKHIDNESCSIDLRQNVFIVDGQHRMLAMMRVYEKLEGNRELDDEEKAYIKEYLEQYRFNCTVLVNYDLWEQGQVFINVNFKQKPVNKSLYYEIFGSVYREDKSEWSRNKIYLAHCLAKTLNERKESPYYQRVKMLGTGVGYISQAFIVEALIPHFGVKGIWQYNFNQGRLVPGEFTYFATELLSFFVAIKQLFSDYWPKEDATKGTLISKTTSFGAFSRIMGLMRDCEDQVMIDALKISTKKQELCELYMQRVIERLTPLKESAETLFGKDSEFAKGSGRGWEAKLYQRLLLILHKSEEDFHKENMRFIQYLDIDEVYEQIQEYVYTNPIEDVDTLANHYEIEDINDLAISSIKKGIDCYMVSGEFNIRVILYLDNEDEEGFPMSFPAKFQATFDTYGKEFKLDAESVGISVNTDKYYK